VSHGGAVVVRLYYADESAFSNERYEIFREGEALAFQAGRTDARGTIAFVPDRGGVWRIRVFSEEGHGLDVPIEIDETQVFHAAELSFFDRYARIIVGVALIFGIFGAINLFSRRRKGA
jgi:nickel transport protein